MTPQQERQIYEKWKSDHPDVTHRNNATAAEWYVRNYVEYRLLPAMEEGISEIADDHFSQLTKLVDTGSGGEMAVKSNDSELDDIIRELRHQLLSSDVELLVSKIRTQAIQECLALGEELKWGYGCGGEGVDCGASAPNKAISDYQAKMKKLLDNQ